MDNEALKDIIEKSKQLSPFEIKDELIHIAKKSNVKSTCKMLNAGRGNPNWTASTPRKSFFKLGEFAVDETERVWCDTDLAGMPLKDGIYARFKEYCKNNKNDSGIKLLEEIIEYGIKEHSFNPDEWLFELVDGIIGDNYPVPDRMLVHIEEVVKEYLIKEMGGNNNYNNYDLFAVEGGTAAMCYIFDSMKANGLLKEGSKIALMVPIFTPYLEIPNLPRYKFDVTYIYASEMDANGNHTWQYPKEELDKLKDPSIECLCVVNPSNPASVSINESGIEYLKHIVNNYNPNLMIVTDDVYGTFCDKFKSLMVTIPYNTLGVYSYSKYFGATGWRLGVIALAKDNIYNKRIASHLDEEKERIRSRYSSLTDEVEKLSFIDRMVADSRHVALNHTAGLSTPQQVQMAIFSIFGILNRGLEYKEKTKEICKHRKELLYKNLIGVPIKDDLYSSNYYDEYDLLVCARMKYGEEFAKYLRNERDPIEFLYELAEKYKIVLLNGSGFEGPSWSIRISLANLCDEQYIDLGKGINELFDKYAMDWKNSINKR